MKNLQHLKDKIEKIKKRPSIRLFYEYFNTRDALNAKGTVYFLFDKYTCRPPQPRLKYNENNYHKTK